LEFLWKEAVAIRFEVLVQYFPGGTKEPQKPVAMVVIGLKF